MDFTRAKKIKQEIANNRIPMGYKRSNGYIIPSDWDVVPFHSLFNRLTRKNTENNQNVLTISAQQGLISQIDYYGTLYASEDTANYSLLYNGDFAYNRSYSSDYAHGAIKRLDAYHKGIVSPLYICFEPKKSTNSDFYIQYFEAGMFNREIYKIAQKGARNHGMLNVSTVDFFNALLMLPPAAEQRHISKVLSQYDQTIARYQQLITELKKQKEYFIQSMFPQQDEKNPRIRFPKFTSPWEQRKLGDFVSFYNGLTYSPNDVRPTGTLVLRSSNVKEGEIIDADNVYVDSTVVNSDNVRDGDIIVVVRNGSRSLIGKHAEIKGFKPNTVIGAFMTGIRSEHPSFVNSLLNTPKFDKEIEMNMGATINQITGYMFSRMEFLIPSAKEQDEIGTFFRSLDNLITLHQRKLDETRREKKALMQLLLSGIVRVTT